MSDTVFVGIDPTAGKRPIHYAVLDRRLRRQHLASGTLDQVLAVVLDYPAAIVAVDAPQTPNGGLLCQPERRASLGLPPRSKTWTGYKVCEYELRKRGIGLYGTPADPAEAPRWMQVGFELFQALRAAGFEPYREGGLGARRQVLEVHPHACYTVMLGHLPLTKTAMEGRLQRQLVLFREGVDVDDPMNVLEEVTPHRLLSQSFDLPGLLDHDSLDALIAAYTAFMTAQGPECVSVVGDADEGQIVLPVAAERLQPKYTH